MRKKITYKKKKFFVYMRNKFIVTDISSLEFRIKKK